MIIMKYIDGGICAAKGFKASGTYCGIKKPNVENFDPKIKHKNDICLFTSDVLCNAAAVYTQNKVKGAPILVTKANLEKSGNKAIAVIANSKNANTCNADGVEKADKMCELVANELNIPKEQVIVASTGGTFKTDSLSLDLGLKNATSGTYQINGGTIETYTGTKTISIGAGDDFGTQYTIDLTATDGNETTSESYTFTKVDPNSVQTIYFDNSSYNWSSVYVYIYGGDNGSASSVAWPGTKMTKDSSTGYYSLVVPEGFKNGKVIFTEGENATTNRYPADMEPGLSLNGASMLFSANNSWTEYKPVKPTKPTTTKPSVTYLYGDVNFDKTIDVKDATLIVKVVTGKVSFNDIQIKSADVNGDGEINVKDATLIQKYSIKMVSSFPVGPSFTVN